jgi:hypothetical protein
VSGSTYCDGWSISALKRVTRMSLNGMYEISFSSCNSLLIANYVMEKLPF